MVLQHLLLFARRRNLLRAAQLQFQERQRQIRLQELELQRQRMERHAKMKQESLLKLVLRDISNPWLLEEGQFVTAYRLTPHLAKSLVDLLYEDLEPKIYNNGAVPGHLKAFVALRLFAHGPYQFGLSNNYKHPCSQPSVSRIINQVTNALIKNAEKFINFPQTRARRVAIEKRFRELGAVEGTLGIIDCTLVHVCRPCTEEELYYTHRHGCHCISCEVVCDGDYNVLSLNPYPGGNPDAFLWRNSEVRFKLERTRLHPRIFREEKIYRILGDAGYTDSPILFTPIPHPRTAAEHAFNDMLVTIRCRVEQLFGQLKERWRCLNKERMLHYQPRKACKLIVACVVLHNFAKMGGVPIDVQDADDLGNFYYLPNLFSYEAGLREKEAVIRRYYS